MTVSTSSNKITYDGNGVTTNFPFTFAVEDSSEIVVIYTDADGVETTLPTSAYTVSINAAVAPNPTPAGGSVTYNPSGTPIALGTKLTIYRELNIVQETSLDNQGTLYPQVIEQALDYITMVAQQLNELFGRAITAPVSDDPSITLELPTAEERALGYLGFASDGSVIVTSGTDSTNPVSSAMEPVVSAASLAAGRAAFGLGTMATEAIGAGLQDDGAGSVRVNQALTSDTISQVVTSAFHQSQRIATGPITYTLPRANTLWNGFSFGVFCNTGLITLACNAADSFGDLASGTSFIVQPGTYVRVWTDAAAAGVWYVESHLLGPAINAGAVILNGYIDRSIAGNALTFTLKAFSGNAPSSMEPVFVVFRSATAATAAPTLFAVTSSLSFTVSSGSTMGFSSATAGRLWVTIFNDANTLRMGAINCKTSTGWVPLSGDQLVTSIAEGGIGGADLAGTYYTAVAVTSKPYVIAAYATWETGLTTAGTWDALPTVMQQYGPGVKLPGDYVRGTQATKTDSTIALAITIGTFTDIPNVTVTHTQVSAANINLVEFTASLSQVSNDTSLFVRLLRGATALLVGDAGGSRMQATAQARESSASAAETLTEEVWDFTPATSSNVYKLQLTGDRTANFAVNASGTDTNTSAFARTASRIGVKEIMA